MSKGTHSKMVPLHRMFISLQIIFERNGFHSLKDNNLIFQKKKNAFKKIDFKASYEEICMDQFLVN